MNKAPGRKEAQSQQLIRRVAKELLERYKKQLAGFLGGVIGTSGRIDFQLHAHERFPAASLIKVPVLIHLFNESDHGRVDLSETVVLQEKDKVGGSGILFELHEGILLTLLDLAVLMIVVSDNTATNLLMDRLGISGIQAKIEEMGLTQTLLARKLMITLDAPPANFTSPFDMYELYRKLLLGEILSPQSTKSALGILSRQQYNEKIPLFLPKGISVAHKTGEISGVRHDCGIVELEPEKIIVCLLTKDVQNEVKTDRVLAELSLAVYHYYSNPKVGHA